MKVSTCVCLALLLWRDQRGLLQFSVTEDPFDGRVRKLVFKSKRKWHELPWSSKKKIIEINEERLIRRFSSLVISSLELAPQGLGGQSYKDLVAACCQALGDDIVVEMVGSLTRRTAAIQDRDLDLQVRRSKRSGRMNEPFTKIDKERVAQNLETLDCVTGPVTIGNVAIKFTIQAGINANSPFDAENDAICSVDLVLWQPRLEEFPNLRGGDDFYANSARINKFLEETPAARAAIIGVKSYIDGRPKGILLEAIAWRLSSSFRFPLTNEATAETLGRNQAFQSFLFFDHMMTALVNWETSIFGTDLKKDLNMLPDKKREKYIQSFEQMHDPYWDTSHFVLITDLLETAWAEQTPEDVYFSLKRQHDDLFPFTCEA